jgi:N-succinyl-L-ornithine transcarbamylase
MHHFLSLDDVSDPIQLVKYGLDFIKNPYHQSHIGNGKILGLFFFNPSLRTRMSTEKASILLGMHTIIHQAGQSWPLEFKDAAVMDGNTSEHAKDAAKVLSKYVNILGIRSFPTLKDRDEDYGEPIINAFSNHGTVPVLNLESATRHPLQALADMMCIEQKKKVEKPKVLLTWAPHPKALPQSVANSFVAWSLAMGYELTITHPEGYELDPTITYGATIEYDPYKAYEDAHFVYAKNWSSYQEYGQILSHDRHWMVDQKKMQNTEDAYFMHCLPVRRNVVVEDAVIDHPNSLIVKQANYRTFAAMAALSTLLK